MLSNILAMGNNDGSTFEAIKTNNLDEETKNSITLMDDKDCIVRVYFVPSSLGEHLHNYKCLVYDEKSKYSNK